jgi:hypothetical protein
VNEQHADEARASIVQFIASLKANKGFEATRSLIRIVPKGLFVDERAVDAVVTEYQSWLLKISSGIAQKTAEKTKQWLFEGHEPERQYLVEGKNVLAGFLIPIHIQTPQQFGLPYYLGSLQSTANYLHPADPELQHVRGLELRHGRLGLEALIKRRNGQVLIPEAVLRSFQALAQSSRFLQRRFPGSERSLSVCVRALTGLVRRARSVPKTFPIIVPYDLKVSKTKELRASGKFLFVEEKGVLVRILEVSGRNLSSFLREELMRAPRERLGSFKLTPKHRDLMGYYDHPRGRIPVHARAFAEFEELIRRVRDPKERFTGWFTASECFEKFSSFYQLSQPIDRRKIAGALERFGIEGTNFKIYGGWIFSISRENAVMRAVAKHVRLPGHRKSRGSTSSS